MRFSVPAYRSHATGFPVLSQRPHSRSTFTEKGRTALTNAATRQNFRAEIAVDLAAAITALNCLVWQAVAA